MDVSPELIVAARRSTVFSSLSPPQVGQLLRAMQPQELPAGAVLFHKGDPGDSMVIVVSGRLGVALDAMGAAPPIAILGPGDAVGEMAFLDPAPRSATVIALSTVELLTLPHELLDALRKGAPDILSGLVIGVRDQVIATLREADRRIKAALRFLTGRSGTRQLQAFADIDAAEPGVADGADSRVDLRAYEAFARYSDEELGLLVRAAPPVTFPDGTYLCREGAPGKACFVIVHGVVEILKRIGSEERLLGIIGAGEVVGHLALVDDAPRTASVRTRGQVVALQTNKERFQQLVTARHPVALHFQEQIAVAGIRQLRMADDRLAHLLAEVDEFRSATDLVTPQLPLTRPAAGKAAGKAPGKGAGKPASSGKKSAPPSAVERAADDFSIELSGDGIDLAGAPAPAPAAAPEPAAKPAPTEGSLQETAGFMRAAMSEWGLSLSDLDGIEVEIPDGLVTAAEMKVRNKLG